jgi:hypothetical protein
MKIIHDYYDTDSFDYLMLRTYRINQAVGRSNRTAEKVSAFRKEITMHTHNSTTVWGTHIGIGRGRDVKGRYQQFRDWWAAHNAARREAKRASLRACWDVKREVCTPLRAEAALEMAIAQGALSIATQPYSLIQ